VSKPLNQIFKRFNTVFWDFDGVIKDSVEVKNIAFERLFSECDKKTLIAIRNHHKENSGLSRFEKIPIYLSWAGKNTSSKNIQKYCQKFSTLVKDSVIDSAWVPGVKKYLKNNYLKKNFIIITATPQDEIVEILIELSIQNYFVAVYGSPITKINAISNSMKVFKCKDEGAIMIGDSLIDYEAAVENNIFFALRQTQHNLSLQKSLDCFKFKDFNHE
tara:strand:- start:208 stop:858 length:651 start_codon:yes stop_codon:yes gene_type:complete